jgi:outer membrane protein X
MNKINLLFTAFTAISLLFVVHNTQAQATKGDMRLGGQLGYGTEIESLGIGARFDYAITDQILLAPDLMYFFGKSEGSVDFSWFDINLNGNYLFDTGNPDITPYVLAGLNIAILSVSVDGFSGFGGFGSGTQIGFNIGGGADFVVGTITVFGELRYVLSSADQLVIAGGVKFPLN